MSSEFDQLYREVILDHYKNPRGHGLIEGAVRWQRQGLTPPAAYACLTLGHAALRAT